MMLFFYIVRNYSSLSSLINLFFLELILSMTTHKTADKNDAIRIANFASS